MGLDPKITIWFIMEGDILLYKNKLSVFTICFINFIWIYPKPGCRFRFSFVSGKVSDLFLNQQKHKVVSPGLSPLPTPTITSTQAITAPIDSNESIKIIGESRGWWRWWYSPPTTRKRIKRSKGIRPKRTKWTWTHSKWSAIKKYLMCMCLVLSLLLLTFSDFGSRTYTRIYFT